MHSTDTESGLLVTLDWTPEIPCEATGDHGDHGPDHPAQWLALTSCGCTFAVCDRALIRARQRSSDTQQGYRCGICDTPSIHVVRAILIVG